ncbi:MULTISPECIES: glycosyltransferase family 2 protein [Halococcus]|nr:MULTISPECIES: glycosyltransferase family 2 protein [Halococcus]
MPDGYVLATRTTDDESGWSALSDGRLDGAILVSPEETVALTYVLADPQDPASPVEAELGDLPNVEIVDSVPVTPESAPSSPVVLWRSSNDERVPLVLREPAHHPAVTDPTSIEGWVVEGLGSRFDDLDVSDRITDQSAAFSRSKPVIGIIAHEANADAILGTILRAREHGFAVFVIYGGDGESEVIRLSRRLGAKIVEPSASARGNVALLERSLSQAARDAGYPGIVFQLPESSRIDYERTLAAFASDGFETTAIPETWSASPEITHVLVGIPAYNAEGAIGAVVEDATSFADQVLVVDDGSADATAERARAAGATVVVHERNRGYGGALKTIFQEADQRGAAHLVTLDADGQHDPADVPKLVQTQEHADADIVIGSRYAPGSMTRLPFVRSIGLGVVNLLTNLSLGRLAPRRWVRDTQSGLRAYSSEAIASLAAARDIGDGMWASTDIMYHANAEGFDFAEVGITIRYDVEDASTQGALSHGTDLIRNIGRFLERTHPLLLLGLPGTIGVIAGTLVGTVGIQQLLLDEPSMLTIAAATVLGVVGLAMVMLSVLFHAMNLHPFYDRM